MDHFMGIPFWFLTFLCCLQATPLPLVDANICLMRNSVTCVCHLGNFVLTFVKFPPFANTRLTFCSVFTATRFKILRSNRCDGMDLFSIAFKVLENTAMHCLKKSDYKSNEIWYYVFSGPNMILDDRTNLFTEQKVMLGSPPASKTLKRQGFSSAFTNHMLRLSSTGNELVGCCHDSFYLLTVQAVNES